MRYKRSSGERCINEIIEGTDGKSALTLFIHPFKLFSTLC